MRHESQPAAKESTQGRHYTRKSGSRADQPFELTRFTNHRIVKITLHWLDDRFHETCRSEPANRSWIPRWDYPTRSGTMARWLQAFELAMSSEEIKSLSRVARSGSEPARRVERAQMLPWLVSLACDKAKDHGYPHELWTT
jgi:hypothetical protein